MNKSFLKKSFNVIHRLGQTANVMALSTLRVAKGEKIDAQLLKESFEQLGTTYIKIGQFIASTPSLFPMEYVNVFQSCLDQTTPVSYPYIAEVISTELESIGKKIDEVFLSVDEKPLASASIAQVHAAKLITGEDVVLKIQKPNVDVVIATDLGVLHGVTKVMEWLAPTLKFASIAPIVDEIRLRMLAETDFIQEAKHIDEFQQFLQFTQNQQVTAPKVYHQFSSKKLLVMERLFGVSMIDTTAMRQYCQNPETVILDTLNTWFASLMFANSFHADLHAGNLILLTDGRIGFIDFGIVGKLKPKVWRACLGMMDSFAKEDYPNMAKNMVAMGMTHAQVDVVKLAEDLQQMMDKIFENGGMVDVGNLQHVKQQADDLNKIMLDMIQVGKRHGIHFPRDFALLTKQLLYFDRFMRVLAPDMDMFRDVKMLQNYQDNL